MTDKEYIKTLRVNDIDVKLGLDSYNRCYTIEYADENNDIQHYYLGNYKNSYMEEVYAMLDPVYHNLLNKALFSREDLTKEEKDILDKYEDIFQAEYSKETT